MANLEELRRVTRTPSPGGTFYQGNMASPQMVDFFAILHHNAPADATFRIICYDGPVSAPGAYRYDSGHVPFWPPGSADAGNLNVRPLRLPEPVLVEGIYFELSTHPVAWEIGGFEAGRFWEWPDVQVGREIGIQSGAASVPVGAGVTHVTKQWAPRYVTGSRNVVDVAEVEEKLLDFQRTNGLWRTFVWAWDLDDPTTWARECMAVTNDSLPAGTREGYLHGALPFAFREQLR